jgi:O-antigen ligase
MARRAVVPWGLVALLILCPLVSGGSEQWRYAVCQVGVLLLWVVRLVFDRRALQLTETRASFLFWALLFLTLILCSWSQSANAAASRNEALRMVCYLALALLVIDQIRYSAQPRHLIGGMVVAATIVALYAIYQRHLSLPATLEWLEQGGAELSDRVLQAVRSRAISGRAFSTFRYPNSLAGYLVLVVPVSAGMYLLHQSRSKSLVWGIVYVCGFYGLLSTLSRAGWACFGLSLCVLIIWSLKQTGSRVLKRWTVLVGLMVVLGILVATIGPQGEGSIGSKSGVARVTDPASYGKAGSEKLLMWRGVLSMVRAHPLWGSGPGTFVDAYYRYKQPESLEESRYAHNEYLQSAAEYGIPGAIVFLVLLVLAVAGFIQQRKVTWASGLFAGLVGFAIHIGVDWDLENVGIAATFWAVIGLGVHRTVHTRRPTAFGTSWIWSGIRAVAAIGICGLALWIGHVALADFHYHRARQLAWCGQGEAAIDEISRAVRMDPIDPRYHHFLGGAYLAREGRGDIAAALHEYGIATGLNSESPLPHYGMAEVYLAAGHPHLACTSLRRAIERYPSSSHYQKLLDDLCMRAGDEAGAHRAWKVAESLDPLLKTGGGDRDSVRPY